MPNGQQVSDDQLILHYYACDDNAFEQLYKRYRRRLYGFFLGLSGDPSVADDLTQETLLKVVSTKSSGQGRYQPGQGDFKNWLLRIALNVWRDHLRRQKRQLPQQPIPDEGATEEERRESKAAPEVPDRRAGPGAIAVVHDFLNALRACLMSLASDKREAFIRIYWLNQTGPEAAHQMGRNEDAVWQLIHRALPQLRDCLQQRGYTTRQGIDEDALRGAMANSVDEAIRLAGNVTFLRTNQMGGEQP
jgi:RNA polymerase sigma-70 factor (ECF subfamily)